ncbi:MAG TPA: hypothetical protein VFO79_10905 [Xanthomonadales bacterium]|nr:hypothetical protein [Xanthomonadales bacterium]
MAASRWVLGLALASACGCAAAQDDDPLFAQDDEAAAEAGGFDWFGDVLLRRDQVNGLENREPIDRLRARARTGFRYTSGAWEFGAAAALAQGSDANKDNRINNDNERSDGVDLDQAYARWSPSEDTAVTLGKTLFPLSLTPLTWDDDLRPIGASVEHSIATGEFDRLRLVGGWFLGDHLYGDDSRIGALQASMLIREGAPWSGEVSIGYLHFDDLGALARNGLGRTNRRAAGRFVSDYELLDLQFALRSTAWSVPVEARLDLVRNLGADDARDGARFSTVFGRSDVAGGWELGLAYERIQRDAVLAAFNADDWWFHSFMRGFMPWVTYGISDAVSVRVAGFFERRDDQVEDVDRLLIDIRAAW